MASTTETGHAKNVANLEELVSYVTGYGVTYNPSKPTIGLSALKTLATAANSSVSAVNAAMPAYSLAVSSREIAFDPLNKLITRALNALKASDSSERVDEQARTIARKVQGKSATPKKKAEATPPGTPPIEGVSTSQMSFDSRLDNFDKLIQFLKSVPQYAPNEEEVKVTALTALYTNLKVKNAAVVAAATPLSNARIARNVILYNEITGLVDIALDAKVYIKSLFGPTSSQYKQISKLEFKPVKM